ncbi:MAG: hypothetical protein AAFS12_00175 [Cyanobacteria bacterium J06632_19]
MTQAANSKLQLKRFYQIVDSLEEAKHLAENADITKILEECQKHLLVYVEINEPSNKLAIQIIKNGSGIADQYCQVEYLLQIAASVINLINDSNTSS